MKFIKILTAVMLFAVCAANAQVLQKPYRTYATTGSAFGGGVLTNSAIIGCNNKDLDASPVITHLNVQAVHASAVATFYKCTNYTVALAATTNTRTNYVGSTNGFGIDTIVVVRHVADDTYERLVCTTPQSTNIVFISDPVKALAAGDHIYQMTTDGTLALATNTVTATAGLSITGEGIYSGRPGYPLLIDCITAAGTNGSIKLVNAKFVP